MNRDFKSIYREFLQYKSTLVICDKDRCLKWIDKQGTADIVILLPRSIERDRMYIKYGIFK